MTEKSPDFLAPKPEVKKANKKVLAVIAGVVALMVMVLFLSMTNQKKVEKTAAPPPVAAENKPLMADAGEGQGLAVPQADKKEQEPPSADASPQIKVVGLPVKDEEAEAARREAEEIHRRKVEAGQQALSSGLMVRREGPKTGAGEQDGATVRSEREDRAYTPAGPDAYDPAADRDKEAFFTRADATQWLSPFTREAGRRYEIKTGTVIPGVMVSGINSDLPGSLIAQVSQNVYDTATGHSLLIPQGSKLYGVYDSRVVYGQSRVLVAWNRVIFPDGSSVTLGAMPGADITGYAGFQDQVDNHYLRIFGSAVLMSLVAGGMSYAVDQVSNNDSGDSGNSTTIQDEMTAALAAQLGQTTLQLLQKNLSIKPTLEIRPGYQFNVVATRDVAFAGSYAAD
jgi:type IV secretion system protein VirB10